MDDSRCTETATEEHYHFTPSTSYSIFVQIANHSLTQWFWLLLELQRDSSFCGSEGDSKPSTFFYEFLSLLDIKVLTFKVLWKDEQVQDQKGDQIRGAHFNEEVLHTFFFLYTARYIVLPP